MKENYDGLKIIMVVKNKIESKIKLEKTVSDKKSMVEILDGIINSFNEVINTAEVGMLSDELKKFDEGMLGLGDLRKRMINLTTEIQGTKDES